MMYYAELLKLEVFNLADAEKVTGQTRGKQGDGSFVRYNLNIRLQYLWGD